MGDLAIGATLAAALSAFMLGGLWYSPVLFGKRWQTLVGLSDEAASSNTGIVFGGAFALALLSAAVFGAFLGPKPELGFALGAGLAAGLGWVAASFGISYLFERRPPALLAINGGYHATQFALYGLCFALIPV